MDLSNDVIGHAPMDNEPTVKIDDGYKVHISLFHGDVDDFGGP